MVEMTIKHLVHYKTVQMVEDHSLVTRGSRVQIFVFSLSNVHGVGQVRTQTWKSVGLRYPRLAKKEKISRLIILLHYDILQVVDHGDIMYSE